MKKLTIVFMVAIGLTLMSCETSSTTDSPKITPDSATLEEGQSIQFVASDGYDYSWSLNVTSYGSLSTRSGDRTTFTSSYTPGTNGSEQTVELTLTSTIQGTGTAEDPDLGTFATAYITLQ